MSFQGQTPKTVGTHLMKQKTAFHQFPIETTEKQFISEPVAGRGDWTAPILIALGAITKPAVLKIFSGSSWCTAADINLQASRTEPPPTARMKSNFSDLIFSTASLNFFESRVWLYA